MTYLKTVKDIDVNNKTVMVRAGLDLPLDVSKDLLDPERVVDETRIRDILPTLAYLIKNKAKIVLAAGWCGRPRGSDPDYSMAPVAKRLERILEQENLLQHEVLLAPNAFEDKTPKSVNDNREEVKNIANTIQPGQIVVLENVRYDPGANQNDPELGKFYASLAEIYVNEAETQNHRKETTIATTPLEIAKKGGEVVYGLQYADVLEKIGALKKTLEQNQRGSFVFGLSGRKIESDPGITSKITVAYELLREMRKGDYLLIGGAVTYTFLLAEHYDTIIDENEEQVRNIVRSYNEMIVKETKDSKDKKRSAALIEKLQKKKSDELKTLLNITDKEIKSIIGDSYIRWGQEGEQIVFAYKVLGRAQKNNVHVINGLDHTIANQLPNKSGMLPVDTEIKLHKEQTGIPQGWLAVAEGPKTLEVMGKAIEQASIYLQSGPYSIEDPRVEAISKTDETLFAAVKKCKGIKIAAGGDTVSRIIQHQAQDAFTTITSAGGATLELIETGTSPGKDAVEKAQIKK
ncbi:MAG: phosphoglycerate kinase [Nanoarchaeota archaeon]|nr:phosphoglycerate kinase [Nanoarchaeota archaeon]